MTHRTGFSTVRLIVLPVHVAWFHTDEKNHSEGTCDFSLVAMLAWISLPTALCATSINSSYAEEWGSRHRYEAVGVVSGAVCDQLPTGHAGGTSKRHFPQPKLAVPLRPGRRLVQRCQGSVGCQP